MAVETGRPPFESITAAAERVAATEDLRTALAALAGAAAEAARADLAVLRVADASGDLVARAVAPQASPLGGEVAATRASADEILAGGLSEPTRRAAERVRAEGVLAVPARAAGRVVGSVELIRIAGPFGVEAEGVAHLIAAHLALAVRTLGAEVGAFPAGRRARSLELAGEALVAGVDIGRAAQQVASVAVEAAGALAAAIWNVTLEGEVELLASAGGEGLDAAARVVRDAIDDQQPVGVAAVPGLPAGATHAVTFALGQPPVGALQLFYPDESSLSDAELPALAAFAARAAHALAAGGRSLRIEEELDRTRALLEVVGAAIARLSLAHTLETAVERIAELLAVDQVGVYLRDDGTLSAAAGRGLAPGHQAVADELLEVALGPLRAREAVFVDVGDSDPVIAGTRVALLAAGQRSVLAVPLDVREESIGLLVAYPVARTFGAGDVSLLTSLAAQLAVAVQNARLHEQATELGEALGDVLESERKTSRQVGALYEISRSFAQTLSLDTTLDAVTATIVEVLDVDAAVIRLPDDRGDQLVPRAVYVAESRLSEAVSAILERPQPRPARSYRPLLLDIASARRLGGAHALLIPFLEKGSTAALLPIATPTELLAQLTILSLDPAEPIGEETLATAQTIAQQAALAIDNARLYQQQKEFAETMQRSLLPRERPAVPGLDVGTVYESAAQVDVGGDVFDFLELADARLAVVLGDVTGHGIDATADMAMAKFVFRSLAREHPEPSEFLARANDVVVGEIAVGKFITMTYLLVDPAGALLCASAGHPAPRLVLPGGSIDALACGGLALGIDANQTYEQVGAQLPHGACVVLYTDGVIEARSGGELFGVDRLDRVLELHAEEPAQAIADAVVAACRTFAGGELGDDCAIVVIKRLRGS